MKWIKSTSKKPRLGMETVVKYSNNKKEIVMWNANLINNISRSKVEFEWIELPKE